MLKRIGVCLIALALVFALLPAQAVTYPTQRGAVNDDAAVLSDRTAADIDALNTRVDGKFIVVTRHFLGGADAQEYCDGLFSAWGLGEEDVLLLLVIGEERYAVTLGTVAQLAISTEQLNSLLSSRLRQPFLQERNYDAAVGGFLLAAAAQIARFNGSSLNTAGLFGTAASSGASANTATQSSNASLFSNWSGNWWNGFFSDDDWEDTTDWDFSTASQQNDFEERSGFSFGKLIVIAVILWLIVRNRRRKGKSGLGAAGWGAAAVGAKQVMKGVQDAAQHRPPRR